MPVGNVIRKKKKKVNIELPEEYLGFNFVIYIRFHFKSKPDLKLKFNVLSMA